MPILKNGFKLPEKILQLFVAQVADEKDEGRVREKIATAERLCNKAYMELIEDGFTSKPMVAMSPQGNVMIFLETDPRPLPEPAPAQDKLWDPRTAGQAAQPNAAPALLLPPE